MAYAALLACAGPAMAQPSTPPKPASQAPQTSPAAPAPQAALDTVTITGRHSTPAVSGFGDQPLATTPIPATRYGEAELTEQGVTRLSGLTGLHASVSDAYNTTGYWDYLSVRGFLLDNRFNYRRDGLPVNAETSLPLANKSGVEVLRGSSGIQAGTSAPGGLVNLLVKRPDRDLTRFHLGWAEGGRVGAQADVSRRLGEAGEFGLRGNLLVERLDTPTQNTRGLRHVAALAADWRGPGGSLLEAEVEHSRQRQPSVPGFSLLGNRIPSPADPRINLNNQAWSQPVLLQGDTASLRWTQPLEAGWKFVAHGMTQRLKNDDRIAFPYGLFDASYNCNPCDRYAANGDLTLWDFRSENERRRSDALDLGVQGKAQLAGLPHQLAGGLLLTRYQQRMQPQVYDIAGTGNASGAVQVTTTATVNDQNTHRDERSSELYLRDAFRLAPQWQAWLGLRHTRLQRESVRTDGSRASDYSDSFTTPWLALSHEWAPQHIVFASWGRGAESDVAPNRTYVVNRGEAVLARSRQWEIGAKGSQRQRNWSLTYFDIQRAQTANLGAACSSSTPDSCTFTFDGLAHHRGLEGELSQQLGPLRLEGSALLLRARRDGSANPAVNGQRPPNVPEYTAKAGASYTVASLPGLTLGAAAVHEGGRTLLPTDGQLRIPAWTRLDANAQWQQPLADQRRLTWSAGITNLANRRAWREAPYQFEHIYLFPLPERSLRLGLQIDL